MSRKWLTLSIIASLLLVFISSHCTAQSEKLLNAVDPHCPHAVIGGPYYGFINVPIILDASQSWDPDNDPIVYEWDLDNDGLFGAADNNTFGSPSDAVGMNPQWTWHVPFTGVITLRVIDFSSEFPSCTDTSYTTVSIGNHAPTSDPDGPYTASQGSCITLDGSGSFDVDPGDVITYEWDLDNDGIFDDCYNIHCEFCVDSGAPVGSVYSVCLKVTDSFGLSNTKCTTCTIESLMPTGVLQGTVTDASTGLPLAGASVSAVGPITRSTTTDAAGFYNLPVLSAGTYNVTVNKFGYISQTAGGVVVTDGATTVQDIALVPAPAFSLQGHVIDAVTSAPISNAQVTITNTPIPPASTDAAGLYAFAVVPQGTYNVTASASGYLSATASVVISGDTVQDFALRSIFTLCGHKFYDANANGEYDPEELGIAGWVIKLTGNNVALSTITEPGGGFEFTDLAEGDYTVCEVMPNEGNWMQTAPAEKCYTVHVPSTEANMYMLGFGNLCVSGGGGLTLGFWSNSNGKTAFLGSDNGASALAMLRALNLRTNRGGAFDPIIYAQVKKWLLAGNAVNMAYMLSVQLAVMELNILRGYVDGDSLIFATGTASANALGFATISAIAAEANAELGLHGYTVEGSAFRAYQEILKNALDSANKNLNFVQGEACTFSFALPQLVVIKHVVNEYGGTAVASDFTMTVTASGPVPASIPGAESPGTIVTLGPGSFSVSETGPVGYEASYSADCSGTIDIGQTRTCTVTNTDIDRCFGVVCPQPSEECLQEGVCDPMTGECSYTPKPAGTACADEGNICTLDVCDAAGQCVHPSGNAGMLCRESTSVCDPAETCTGTGAECPTDVNTCLFSFETGAEVWAGGNWQTDPGTTTQSNFFHTDGNLGLQVISNSAWFTAYLNPTVNFTGKTKLKYDLQTMDAGTSTSVAIQFGDSWTWCQSPWGWVNPGTVTTVEIDLNALGCTSPDFTKAQTINIWFSTGEFYIDAVRIE